jgi:hypothetical protein
MPALNSPQFESWYSKWQANLNRPDPGQTEKEFHAYGHSRDGIPQEELHDWVNAAWFQRGQFPSHTLMTHDLHMANPNRHWDPNPSVARLQKTPTKPKDAPESWRVNEDVAEQQHEAMRGTGIPSHVTVYHFGAPPKGARYASGSVDPEWPEAVRTGWRSKDLAINRGRLHIYLVPHEDIIASAGAEQEVFFRRGTQLNKKRRSKRQQMRAESKVEDDFWNG